MAVQVTSYPVEPQQHNRHQSTSMCARMLLRKPRSKQCGNIPASGETIIRISSLSSRVGTNRRQPRRPPRTKKTTTGRRPMCHATKRKERDRGKKNYLPRHLTCRTRRRQNAPRDLLQRVPRGSKKKEKKIACLYARLRAAVVRFVPFVFLLRLLSFPARRFDFRSVLSLSLSVLALSRKPSAIRRRFTRRPTSASDRTPKLVEDEALVT